jgi:hypothetical protein
MSDKPQVTAEAMDWYVDCVWFAERISGCSTRKDWMALLDMDPGGPRVDDGSILTRLARKAYQVAYPHLDNPTNKDEGGDDAP